MNLFGLWGEGQRQEWDLLHLLPRVGMEEQGSGQMGSKGCQELGYRGNWEARTPQGREAWAAEDARILSYGDADGCRVWGIRVQGVE